MLQNCTPPAVHVPVACLRALATFRLLGPHLREHPQLNSLQRSVESALEVAGGAAEQRADHEQDVPREELQRRWMEAHEAVPTADASWSTDAK